MDLIIMSAIDQKIGSGELGTSKCYSVKEFINLSLEIKGISYKYYKKELASWHLEDGRKIFSKTIHQSWDFPNYKSARHQFFPSLDQLTFQKN